MSTDRRSTPTRLLTRAGQHLRDHLREIRRVVCETQHQVLDFRAAVGEQLAQVEAAVRTQADALDRIEASLGELAPNAQPLARSRAHSGRSPKLLTSALDDVRILPHFLRHYANAGIEDFYIIATPTVEATVKDLSQGYRVTTMVTSNLPDAYSSGTNATTTMWELRSRYQRDDEWVAIVDLDEFVDFDDSVADIIASAEAEGANVVQGLMFDRFTADGKLVEFDPAADLRRQYPVRARFVREVMGGNDHKAVLVKGHLQGGQWNGQGAEHHLLVGERDASRMLVIDHYRWVGKSLERLKERRQMVKDAGTHWWIEYDRILRHYESHGERFAWEEFGGELVEQREPLPGAA